MQQALLVRRSISTRLLDATSQKTAIFILIAVSADPESLGIPPATLSNQYGVSAALRFFIIFSQPFSNMPR